MKIPKEIKNKNSKKKSKKNYLLEMTENVNFFELFEDGKISSKVPIYKVKMHHALIMLVIKGKISYKGINSKGNLIFAYSNAKIGDNIIKRKISNQEIAFLDYWMMSHKFKVESISINSWEKIVDHFVDHILSEKQWFDFDILEKIIFSGENKNILSANDLKIFDFEDVKFPMERKQKR